MSLETKYLGLSLKNPIIVGASNLVTDLDILKKLEENGAAAIVYKSLFEEQIQLEGLEQQSHVDEYGDRHAEMGSPFPDMNHAGPEEFLHNLRKAKEAVSIPLIASLNCVYEETWIEFARKIQETGVDALELNFYAVPKELDVMGKAISSEQFDILEAIVDKVDIPISVKLSPYYTNTLYIISEMDKKGVQGFVIFNRLFQPDIDLEKEKHHFPYNLSNPEDNRLALRFSGLLYDMIKADICANSGIYTGQDVLKMIMAGADVTQVVSTLYKNGPKQIGKMLKEMEEWMDKKGYKNLDDFRGKLSRKKLKDPFTYKRAQYVDILMRSEEIFKKYPIV
ncbi:MAG: dihydroorotate dehydrogenase-like protein [Bacteroidota bacterium]|nr:dihydroorotate dehydrogenase-like protein [Bacteroidota bacterium]